MIAIYSSSRCLIMMLLGQLKFIRRQEVRYTVIGSLVHLNSYVWRSIAALNFPEMSYNTYNVGREALWVLWDLQGLWNWDWRKFCKDWTGSKLIFWSCNFHWIFWSLTCIFVFFYHGQPPASFVAAMQDYVKELSRAMQNKSVVCVNVSWSILFPIIAFECTVK